MQSDSCAGWPAVNRVSDRPLLLLIVSISVPAEKWDCCGQTQAIDLQLVSDLPALSYGGRKGVETRVKLSGCSQIPCLAPVPGRTSGTAGVQKVPRLFIFDL